MAAGGGGPAGAYAAIVAPVVDSHAHIFPYLGDASGFATESEHRQFQQLYMATHGEPVRRLSDHREVTQQTLHDGRLTDPSSLYAVNFRVGRFGRFEWTANGTDLYLQFFPPTLQAMDSPAEFMPSRWRGPGSTARCCRTHGHTGG